MTDRDDPKLTAFALGELGDAERSELEAALAADPGALEEVAQIRELAAQLEAELAAEPLPTLTPGQRAAVLSASRPWWRREAVGWAAAAGVGLLIYGGLSAGRGSDAKTSGHGSGEIASIKARDSAPITSTYRPNAEAGRHGDRPSSNPSTLPVQSLVREGDKETALGSEYEPVPVLYGPEDSVDQLKGPARTSEHAHETGGKDAVTTGTTAESGQQYPGPELGLDLSGWSESGNGTPALGGVVVFGGREADRKNNAVSGNLSGYYTLALKQAGEGEYKGAIESVNRAIEIDPNSVSLLTLRATALLRNGDLDGALGDYDRALQLTDVGDEARLDLRSGLLAAREQGAQAMLGFVEKNVWITHRPFAPSENPFVHTEKEALSTFSVDVDTALYASMRRDLTQHYVLPQAENVRIEELINYFDYGYAPPAKTSEHPFAAHVEVAGCPWNAANRLVRVGLKGYEVQAAERPASNLVFLLDVSGSMSSEKKLPLLKRALRMLVPQLNQRDRVAIVVYAGASGVVLDSTQGDQTKAILSAIENLQSGGSTNGGAGIELAYSIASRNFIEGGVNRVILATDGDFNVGVTQRSELLELIERKATSKVFLSVLGFGVRDSADGTMEQLADHGNGVYAYLDTLREAKKVLVDEMSGTLFTIAKDVKLQLEFNPAQVASYRLVGYENRVLAAQDFNDDTKDAGEIGAGHTVTALYEIVPAKGARAGVDPLRYQDSPPAVTGAKGQELLFLKLRYKQPEGDTSKLMEQAVVDSGHTFAQASQDFRFAASVAAFGMLLRNSSHAGTATLAQVEAIAQENPGLDRHGYRAEFVELVGRARKITGQ